MRPCGGLTWIAALGAGLALVGCQSRVVSDIRSSTYSGSEVAYAADGRDMKVVVIGAPFGGDPAAFARQVATTFDERGIPGMARTHFTLTPNETARPIYQVVVAFNLKGATLNSALCRGEAVETTPVADGKLVAQGAFCRYGSDVSGATGWAEHVRSPEDPGFRNLLNNLLGGIFPPSCWMPGCG